MKPAAYHYAVAHTSIFSMGLGVAIAITLMLLILQEEGALAPDLGVWLWVLVAVILAGLIGLILGVIVIWGILLSHLAARIQGWPFKVGEEVVILKGRHKNRITKIYEIWEERGQVRVDLGEELKQQVNDVFCAVEVCRTQSPIGIGTPLEGRPSHTTFLLPTNIMTASPRPSPPLGRSVASILARE